MTAADEIKRVMKEAGFNQTQLAALVGMKNQSNVSEALKRDIKYSLFAKMINAMGYEIIIQKKKPGRKSVEKEEEE
jgi:predicted XRE-type DNA-binding protein